MRFIGTIIALALVASAAEAKPPVEHHRWGIKTSMASTDEPQAVPLALLLALPIPRHGPKRTLEKGLIPSLVTIRNVTLKEGDTVATTGYLRVVASEPDGDLHLQLSTTRDGTDDFFIIEVPNPRYARKGLSRADAKAVRDYVVSLVGHLPGEKGIVLKEPPLVWAEGQLFYDVSHEKVDGSVELRGKRGMLSYTCWEIHPVKLLRPA